MKVKKFGFNKKILRYISPAGLTLLIYGIILAVKGIYPFGDRTIDYYDMAQQIAAFYYHVYDSLHGTKDFFYDWYSALGTNMAMSTSGCSNISPFNLFFLLIRRSSLLESLSVFNGLKLMCMSITMFFYLEKTQGKAPYYFKLAASTGYAFCGFVLVLYITNQWVDIAVMFPLIMYFYDKLLDEGKIKGYVITLTITLIASYYLGFMILIFIFLYTGIRSVAAFIWDGKETETDVKKEQNFLVLCHIPELGIGTLLSLALSAFILAPQLTQMLSSARFHNGNEGSNGIIDKYIDIISHVHGDYTTRWWTLLGVSLAAAVILTGMIRFRKDRRSLFMTVSMIFIMVSELFFESINLIWHFGSYIQYPIRNGFIIYFVFAYLMCGYAAKMYSAEAGTDAETDAETGKWYIGFLGTIIGFLMFIAFYRNHLGMPLRKVFHLTSFIMIISFIVYFILLNVESLKKSLHLLKKKRLLEEEKTERERISRKRYLWSAGIFVFEILCYGFLLFGKPDFITGYAEEKEQNGEYIYICEELREKLSLQQSFGDRIKNPDESLNANYGFVLMQPALSNWTHMIAPFLQEGAAKWGYSVQFTRLLDAGGTVFSDALLGIGKVISLIPQDERLYEALDSAVVTVDHLSGETAEYTLYKPVFTLPYGLVVRGVSDKEPAYDIVELHNHIYSIIKRGLADAMDIKSDTLVDEIATGYVKDDIAADAATKMNIKTSKGAKTVVCDLYIDKETALYMSGSDADLEFANCTIEVRRGGATAGVLIPTIGDPDNIYYPAHFNNNAVYLGTFENERVEVTVKMDKEKGECFKVDIMGLDLNILKDFCDLCNEKYDDNIVFGKNSVVMNRTVTGEEEDAYVCLPITYDKGWKVKVNGRKVKASMYAGLFTAIPVSKGENEIIMKFTPPGMMVGMVISTLAFALIIIYVIISRVREEYIIKTEEFITNISPVIIKIYMMFFFLVLIIMYLVPVISGIFSLLSGK
ncbi:MAG: YfhO family protein [Lachnospiraceae bacterium]|nr:YfhO family protein [Lachnospiraceae bacterium]